MGVLGNENIFFKINCNLLNYTGTFLINLKIHISFNATAFFPDTTQKNIKQNYVDSNYQRNLVLEYDTLQFINQETKTFQIKGLVLLANSLVNVISIESILSSDSNVCFEQFSEMLIIDSICAYS